MQVNPQLAELITEMIGSRSIKRPEQLISLLKYSTDELFLTKVDQLKHANKKKLARLIYHRTGIVVDVQIKRLHEYKRQLLNVFHNIYLYNELKGKSKYGYNTANIYFCC